MTGPDRGTVEANQAALDACPLHAFAMIRPGNAEERIKALFQCARCGGTVRGRYVFWYQQGLKHGREGRQ